MTEFNDQSLRRKKAPDASWGPTAGLAFRIPHPLQDLTGAPLITNPIPEHVYQHLMTRDARILKSLANI